MRMMMWVRWNCIAALSHVQTAIGISDRRGSSEATQLLCKYATWCESSVGTTEHMSTCGSASAYKRTYVRTCRCNHHIHVSGFAQNDVTRHLQLYHVQLQPDDVFITLYTDKNLLWTHIRKSCRACTSKISFDQAGLQELLQKTMRCGSQSCL